MLSAELRSDSTAFVPKQQQQQQQALTCGASYGDRQTGGRDPEQHQAAKKLPSPVVVGGDQVPGSLWDMNVTEVHLYLFWGHHFVQFCLFLSSFP